MICQYVFSRFISCFMVDLVLYFFGLILVDAAYCRVYDVFARSFVIGPRLPLFVVLVLGP